MQILETLPKSSKNENKFLKKNQVEFFEIISYPKLVVMIKTKDSPNIGRNHLVATKSWNEKERPGGHQVVPHYLALKPLGGDQMSKPKKKRLSGHIIVFTIIAY